MKKIIVVLAIMLMAGSAQAAVLSITVPNDQVNRVLDAFDYQNQICTDGVCVDNPVSAQSFMQQEIIKYIKKTVQISEKRAAVAAIQSVDIDVTE